MISRLPYYKNPKTWVENFYNAYNPKTVRRANIACPKYSKNIPYAFSSVVMRDECAGVRKEHPGVAIFRLRMVYNLSRAALAKRATEEGAEFSAYVTSQDILNYESGRCCPKIDKFTAIKMAIMSITGMSERGAERYLAGYTEATTMRTKWAKRDYSEFLKGIEKAEKAG